MGFQGSGQGLYVDKDPDEVERYVLDFSLWLGDDDLSTVTPSSTGVTVDSATINVAPMTVTEAGASRTVASTKGVIVWLSGGMAGVEGKVQISIVTGGGRKRDVTFRVLPRNR